jgi:hypothetical protein
VLSNAFRLVTSCLTRAIILSKLSFLLRAESVLESAHSLSQGLLRSYIPDQFPPSLRAHSGQLLEACTTLIPHIWLLQIRLTQIHLWFLAKFEQFLS